MTSSNSPCGLDCTGKHLSLCIHPSTYNRIAEAAEAANVSMPDFLLDAAWEKARELRDREAKHRHRESDFAGSPL